MMCKTVFLAGFAFLAWSCPAVAANTSLSAAFCRTERDRAVARLDQEELALRGALDADAAVMDAPVYRLSETEEALIAEIAAARARVAADYRACLARVPRRIR